MAAVRRMLLPHQDKLCELSELPARAATLPRPLVMTNGVFDLLHVGHVSYLAQARALGASLVVAINDDDSVRRLGKGPGRPLNRCEDRMTLLAALASTSLLTSFSDDHASRLVAMVRPDLYVKGGDYAIELTAEAEAARRCGARVLALNFVSGYSTSQIIRTIVNNEAH